MNKKVWAAVGCSLLAVAPLLSGCSSEDGNSSGDKFTIALTPSGIPEVVIHEAAQTLRADGYDVEVVEVAEPELLVEGIVNGRFQFSATTTTAALLGAQQGGGVKIISDLLLNSWTLYGNESVSSCEDLEGKRLAIHSQAGVSTAMVRNYVASECPGVEPEYLVIEGSPNRYAALTAGEIDASPLELADAVSLENEGEGRFNLLTNFAESLPEVHPTTIYGSDSFMSDYPDLTEDFLQAILEQSAKAAEDPEYLKGLIDEHIGEIPFMDEVAEKYAPLFATDGSLDEQAIEETIQFAVDAEAIEPGLTVEQAADLSYLEDVQEALAGG